MEFEKMQRNSIRASLLKRGITLKEFSKMNGFKYCTVQKVLYRIMNNPGYKPHGTVTRQILSRLDECCREERDQSLDHYFDRCKTADTGRKMHE